MYYYFTIIIKNDSIILTIFLHFKMDQKFLERFAKLMEDQTVEPSKTDVIAVVNEFFLEQKQNKKKAKNELGDEPKKKRPLSEYNIFIREQMIILKDTQINANQKMKHIAALWKTKKDDIDNE